jgi:hypothetical protein
MCPEKENSASIPACCNCQLAEGEKSHPDNYRGCRHARKELQRRKAQRAPKTATGRVSLSRLRSEAVQHSSNSNLLPWQTLPQE